MLYFDTCTTCLEANSLTPIRGTQKTQNKTKAILTHIPSNNYSFSHISPIFNIYVNTYSENCNVSILIVRLCYDGIYTSFEKKALFSKCMFGYKLAVHDLKPAANTCEHNGGVLMTQHSHHIASF